MTGSQRILAVAIAGTMLLGGFAFGRMGDTPNASAEINKSSVSSAAPVTPVAGTTQASAENQSFYLSDYKTGYAEGFASVANGQTAAPINTSREGYNEGFKQGFADAYQGGTTPQAARTASVASPVTSRIAQQEQVFRPAPVQAKKSSKLKTVLTIAAPAAIGAGVGAAVGGGKGAGVGALVGGGGGALYHLLKNRN
jgi:hypothetical protein